MWHENRWMDKTTLYLTSELRWRLREAARRTGRRQADVIRSALDAYLDEHRPDGPRSIGAGEDEELYGTDTETWIRERWRNG
jgi:predicted transcriptional regulator